MTKTIQEIKQMLANISNQDDPQIALLYADPRKGVHQLLNSWEKKMTSQINKKNNFLKRFSYERELWSKNYQFIAGVDEVGRGPLAGPVLAAAVILPKTFDAIDVIDSKQLSVKKRNELYQTIIEQAISIGIGEVDAEMIDEVNIYQATKIAMTKAINNLAPQPDTLLIDAMTLSLDIPQQSLIKGDALSNSIGAASIIAKVTRDKIMADYDIVYPGYDFKQNSGYGTSKHLAGLKKKGLTPIHRRSFKPVQDILQHHNTIKRETND
ncbi:ribonuclease HII [Leuconostoc palmae]|uniref:ribonuclease HII n=1 Tax=Leuconostoc palmae TaxID=501487 RepID=UPI001C7C9EB5|nr:ribonuclease HII [Leuconostoc palmae]